MNTPTIHHGDCIEVMRGMADNTIDAIVCDPPYSLAFMSRTWDTHDSPVAFQNWCETWATEALRILRPGGFMASFGGTRTFHRLAVGIEDAGFQVRDSIGYGHSLLAWVHGQGFPKGKNALKPAWEPIVLARKPLVGTVAANVIAHGTGALNIDACRIGAGGQLSWAKPRDMGYLGGTDSGPAEALESPVGRWPANVALSEDQAAALDQMSAPNMHSAGKARDSIRDADRTGMFQMPGDGNRFGDSGGASRFFFVAPNQQEAPHVSSVFRGVDGNPSADPGLAAEGVDSPTGPTEPRFMYVAKAPARERPKVDGVAHPTVKPIALMRWLVKLVTPTGGTILDPFAGSGTTVEAAMLEGFDVIGIEREADYLPLIQARIDRSHEHDWWEDFAGNRECVICHIPQPDDLKDPRYGITPPGLFDLDDEASA